MKVRCVNNSNGDLNLTVNKVYDVRKYTISRVWVIDDLGCRSDYQRKWFEIVEENVSSCACCGKELIDYEKCDCRGENMKEYTIQEVFEFEEETIFQRVDTKRHFKVIDGNLYYSQDETLEEWCLCYMNFVTMQAKFTLVKKDKQVDFMEAMRAHREGKTIIVRYIGTNTKKEIEKILEPVFIEGAYCLRQGDDITPYTALQGTWFIKEVD